MARSLSTSRSSYRDARALRAVYGAKLCRPTAAKREGLSVHAAAPFASPQHETYLLKSGIADYYAVLQVRGTRAVQVDDNADLEEIKAAYRNQAKLCHPDFTGDAGHNMCILLNEAYETLSNPILRAAYNSHLQIALRDEEDGYTGEMLSKWIPELKPKMARHDDPAERRAVFVDEQSCIGCKNCVWCAQATFRIEASHGRSRVFAQWLNDEETLQTAIDSCPVDCIHWVDKDELPALEYVCRTQQQRVGVSTMMAQQSGSDDVFDTTKRFLKERRRLEEARREAASASSPMQEAAREAAAAALAQKRGGWFGEFSFRMAQQFSAAAGGYSSTSDDESDGPSTAVGQRKRTVRWNDVTPGQATPTVPLERALVPLHANIDRLRQR